MVFCNLKLIQLKNLKLYRHNPYFSRWFSAIELANNEIKFIRVTILILVDGFLQYSIANVTNLQSKVTILILVDGFLQFLFIASANRSGSFVTILILVDGFLQYYLKVEVNLLKNSHNPYFSRWFSAIAAKIS